MDIKDKIDIIDIKIEDCLIRINGLNAAILENNPFIYEEDEAVVRRELEEYITILAMLNDKKQALTNQG